jgi:hypothetical protein
MTSKKIKKEAGVPSRVSDFPSETTLKGMLHFHYIRRHALLQGTQKGGYYIMLKRHSQYFKEFIFDRTGEIGEEILIYNQRYRELNAEIYQVQRALTDNLSPQLQFWVDRYDDAVAEQDGIVSETMYRQGLIDGIKLTGMIHKFFGKWLPS